MAGQYVLDAPELRLLARSLDEGRAGIAAELTRLESLVDAVTTGWRGEAASAYRVLQHRWNADAGRLGRVLAEMSQAVDATARRYVGTEHEQRAGLGAITAALG